MMTRRRSKATADLESGGEVLQDHASKECCSDATSDTETEGTILSDSRLQQHGKHRIWISCALIMFVGCAAAAALDGIGIAAARQEQRDLFDRRASDIVQDIDSSMGFYRDACLHLHGACMNGITHERFREQYEYLSSTGPLFGLMSFNPNVTHAERPVLEGIARDYYQEAYPDLPFTGFRGLEPDSEHPLGLSSQPRSNQSFYFPAQYVEPIAGNEGSAGFDLFSSPLYQNTIHRALDTWKPAMTPGLKFSEEDEQSVYSVILMHPGIPLSTRPELKPRDIASITVRIPDLLMNAMEKQRDSITVYIYDATETESDPIFLGGGTVTVDNGSMEDFAIDDELSLHELRSSTTSIIKETTIDNLSRRWTIVVVAEDGTFQPNYFLVIFGSVVIFVACLCFAVWLRSSMRRHAEIAIMTAKAEADKAAFRVQQAKKAAKTERQLNDFIAHEVRNPLSAAMSACSLVSTTLRGESTPLPEKGESKKALEDLHVIDSSLSFINDLLLNMLDVHRAGSKQIRVDLAPTNIMRDILSPVKSMMHARNDGVFNVEIECVPDSLIVSTDPMRLKQILLNLGRNSCKYMSTGGFVRIRAEVVNDNVVLIVEDSGPGIPAENRHRLFSRFQESLALRNQGSGIGLSLCQQLAELLEARIWLDESYDSGLEGSPGARFVIDLQRAPLQVQEETLVQVVEVSVEPDQLPETLSVLFTDDDFVLRKLFIRAIRKLRPNWTIYDAASGEEALALVDDSQFDLIFMDQYMTSTKKHLLGTETTTALRAKGVTAHICGLSANDVELKFLDAGADAFMRKPFPCDKEDLTKELLRVLNA